MNKQTENTAACPNFDQLIEFSSKLRALKINRWDIESVVTDLRLRMPLYDLDCEDDIVFDSGDETILSKLMLSFLTNTLLYIAKQMKNELQLNEIHLFEFLISPKLTSKIEALKNLFDKNSPYFIFYYTVLSFVFFDRDYYVYMSSFTLLELKAQEKVEFWTQSTNNTVLEVFDFIKQLVRLESSVLLACFSELFREEDDSDAEKSLDDEAYSQILAKIENLLEREFIVYKPNNKTVRHNGFNLFDGRVAINWEAVYDVNPDILKARFLVIFLHELAHSCRYIHAIGQKIMKPTPARLKGESGYFLEKTLFGISISKNVGCIDERIAKLLLLETNYETRRFLRKDKYAYKRYLGHIDYVPQRACIHENNMTKTRCGPCLSRR